MPGIDVGLFTYRAFAQREGGVMQKRILIVDDEPDTVEMLASRLAHNGYDVLKAHDGAEAVKIAKKERPDLILLDIIMPGMDGATAAGVLKESPDTKDIPVIFLTCLFSKEDEKRGNVIGGTYFLAKPYDADEILNVIKEKLRSPDSRT